MELTKGSDALNCNGLAWVLSLLGFGVVPGCARSHEWNYALKDVDGNASLVIEKPNVVVQLEGVSVGSTKNFGQIQVSGPGGDTETLRVGELVLKVSYRNGSASLTCAGRQIVIGRGGRQIVAGDQKFDVNQNTVLEIGISEDGVVTTLKYAKDGVLD